MGKLPHPKSKIKALIEVQKIASDIRGLVLLENCNKLFDSKLRAIVIVAKRGLKINKTKKK